MGRRVPKHIIEYAAVIGINSSAQFEKEVIRALFIAISGIFDAVRLKRPSVIRKEFLRVSNEAEAAVKSLHRLRVTLDELFPAARDWLKNLDLVERISLATVTQDHPPFYALSSVSRKARLRAEELEGMDKGGAPQMYPFKMLIVGLAIAFENATKRKAKVTWNDESDPDRATCRALS